MTRPLGGTVEGYKSGLFQTIDELLDPARIEDYARVYGFLPLTAATRARNLLRMADITRVYQLVTLRTDTPKGCTFAHGKWKWPFKIEGISWNMMDVLEFFVKKDGLTFGMNLPADFYEAALKEITDREQAERERQAKIKELEEVIAHAEATLAALRDGAR